MDKTIYGAVMMLTPWVKSLRDSLINTIYVLRDGTHTYLKPQAQHVNKPTSTIDLTISTPGLALRSVWEVLPNTHGSDHYPILTSVLPSAADTQPSCDPSHWVFSKADWEQFHDLCLKGVTEDILEEWSNPCGGVAWEALQGSCPIATINLNPILCFYLFYFLLLQLFRRWQPGTPRLPYTQFWFVIRAWWLFICNPGSLISFTIASSDVLHVKSESSSPCALSAYPSMGEIADSHAAHGGVVSGTGLMDVDMLSTHGHWRQNLPITVMSWRWRLFRSSSHSYVRSSYGIPIQWQYL